MWTPYCLGAVLALLAIGLVMVGSASMDVSSATFADPLRIVLKQLVFVVIGLVLMGAVTLVPVSRIEQFSWVALVVAFSLLSLVLLVGREINGSIRWIPLVFFNLQASEVAKLGVVIYMAGYLVRHLDEVRTKVSGFIKPLIVDDLYRSIATARTGPWRGGGAGCGGDGDDLHGWCAGNAVFAADWRFGRLHCPADLV